MPDPLSDLQRLGQEFDAEVVTQADVERLAGWRARWQNCVGEMEALAQAFACHRIAAIEAARPMIEAEVFEKVFKKARGTNADLCKTPSEAYRVMLAAIRALIEPQS